MHQLHLNSFFTGRYGKRAAHLLMLVFTVAILDYSLGALLDYYYFKQQSGWLYRTTYALNETNAELIILGSSRANHHYHPDVIGQRLHFTYYNAGRDGSYLFYHYAVLKGILKRYKPKMVILDFGITEFMKNQESYDRISYLLPYYKTHPEIRSIIELKSTAEKLKLISRIYPFNSSLVTIVAGNPVFHMTKDGDKEGYIPLHNKWNEPLITYNSSECYEFDTTEIRIYKMLIQDCINAGVKLYIVASPYFHKLKSTECSILEGRKIAGLYNIPFIDFSGNEYFTARPQLFDDSYHLNDQGARVFSGMLMDTITGNTAGTPGMKLSGYTSSSSNRNK